MNVTMFLLVIFWLQWDICFAQCCLSFQLVSCALNGEIIYWDYTDGQILKVLYSVDLYVNYLLVLATCLRLHCNSNNIMPDNLKHNVSQSGTTCPLTWDISPDIHVVPYNFIKLLWLQMFGVLSTELITKGDVAWDDLKQWLLNALSFWISFNLAAQNPIKTVQEIVRMLVAWSSFCMTVLC